jgi:hypothetical protein
MTKGIDDNKSLGRRYKRKADKIRLVDHRVLNGGKPKGVID